ncbi:hypothetical protein [Nocardia bovistercoris]|uniref:Uncharacterized protein n=1 Tax=Nocardia bovistercoris TaxID=2785916 RepID=A0A931N3P1_9NOCA|nr:hypothetical protein [Nocardia bovistercoris]MBH0777937.1 hypothetical protein [Nocardia bovistercoris]
MKRALFTAACVAAVPLAFAPSAGADASTADEPRPVALNCSQLPSGSASFCVPFNQLLGWLPRSGSGLA